MDYRKKHAIVVSFVPEIEEIYSFIHVFISKNVNNSLLKI